MKIKVYASPSDVWSKKAVAWLKKRKIAFEYLDVMDNHQLSTPVFDIDGKILVGFDEVQLTAVLS
jgi:glutaredoxin